MRAGRARAHCAARRDFAPHARPLPLSPLATPLRRARARRPILSTRSGIRTADVGVAQLSMHSIREMCGADDVGHAVRFFAHLYARYAALEATVDHAD